jgi:hypothetical protein
VNKNVNIILKGGLGNQLFQFFTAYFLSKKLKMNLAVDVSNYKNNNYRQFQLLNLLKTNKNYFKKFKENFFLRKLKKIYHLFFFNNFEENNAFSYSKAFEKLDDNKNINLIGFFQSEKYFHANRNEIIRILNFNKNKRAQNRELASKILNSQSVAMHIRGGDYINFEKENPGLGILSKLYYKKAIKIIAKNLNNFNIYIFTDDKSYFFKKNFLNSYKCTLVDSGSDINDLYLMSLCKHFIISNSTYSWWGAFLSIYRKKIIISPKKWKLLDSNRDNYYQYRHYI